MGNEWRKEREREGLREETKEEERVEKDPMGETARRFAVLF